MANDLDFKHGVSEVPQGQPLPRSQRTESAHVTPAPDIQSSINNYAAATNWMSAIGSQVAAKASNAIATKMGTELGKNPKGDIGIPLTEFDEAMQKSYQTQASATLGMQANKLISDSNIELAKAPRLSPGLIDRTNKSINIGLQNIFKNAPAEVRGQLESHYGQLQLNETNSLAHRMIKEQREDMRNNTVNSAHVNAENAYSFAVNGNFKAAEETIETTKRANTSSVQMRVMTPEEAKSHVDTVKISYLSGKAVHDYEAARAAGKGPEYLKSLADKADKADPYYMAVSQNLISYIGHQDTLRSQDQQLRMAKFNETLAMNPNSSDIPTQLQDLQDNVSPIAFEKAKLSYIQARKAYDQTNSEQLDLTHNWGDSETFARAPDKAITKTFDSLVQNVVQKQGIPRDEAEVQVALSAGAPVPIFVKTLNDKLTSGNPINISSAAMQIQHLRDVEGGHALIGLSKQSEAIATQFQHRRGSMPDDELARDITHNLVNIDESKQKILDNAWSKILANGGAGGMSGTKPLYEFALSQVGHGSSDFGGKFFDVIYGNDIYEQLKANFDASGGDWDTAKKMTQNYVDQRYGETRVNGSIQVSDRPIEKVLGYKDPDVVPFVQQDLLKQLNTVFEQHQDNKNDYWSINPVEPQTGMRSTFRKTFPPAEIIRHVKTDKGEKTYRYPLALVGRPGNEWDVVLKTPTGNANIFLVASNLGITTYKPNAEEIRKNYQAHINNSGWF